MTGAVLQDHPFAPGAAPFALPIHQQPIWTALNAPTAKQRYQHFQVQGADRVLAEGLIRHRRVLPGVSLAAIQRGPMTATPEDLALVLPALEKEIRRSSAVSLTVNPAWLGPDAALAARVLETQGYTRVPRNLQNFPTTTAILDLSQDDDGLMAAMTQTGRRHLRKALKAGVTCRPMQSADEAKFANDIMAQMATETGLVTDSQHDFRAHYAYLCDNPQAGHCLVTCLDGDIFGAAVNYAEGQIGYNMLIATRSDVQVPRAHGLMWASIQGLRDIGCTRFDMVGYPDPAVETDAGAAGRGAFKRGFGPEIVPVLPLYTKPLRPLLHKAVTRLKSRHRQTQSEKAS